MADVARPTGCRASKTQVSVTTKIGPCHRLQARSRTISDLDAAARGPRQRMSPRGRAWLARM